MSEPDSYFDAMKAAQCKVASKTLQKLTPSERDQARMSRPFDPVRIPNKGVGYIANKDIPSKTILIEDIPLLLGPPIYRISGAYLNGKEAGDAELASMAVGLAAMLTAQPKSVQRAILMLCNGLPGCPPLIGIYRSNALPLHEDGDPTGGLFSAACRVNHSCAPNCTAYWNEATGRMTIRTIKDVKKGEEITITYTNAFTSPERQEILLNEYGFKCTCEFCTLDEKEKRRSDRDRNFIETAIQRLTESDLRDTHPRNAFDGAKLALAIMDEQKLPWLKTIVYNACFEIAAIWGDKRSAIHLAKQCADGYDLIAGSKCPDEMRMRAYAEDPTTFVGWAKNGTSYPEKLPHFDLPPIDRPILHTSRYDLRSVALCPEREMFVEAMKNPAPKEASEFIPEVPTTTAATATKTKKKAKKKKKKRANTILEVGVANEANGNHVKDDASAEDEGESLPPYSILPAVGVRPTDESIADQATEDIDLAPQDHKDIVSDDILIEVQEPPPVAVDEIHPTSSQQDDVEDILRSSETAPAISGQEFDDDDPSDIQTHFEPSPFSTDISLEIPEDDTLEMNTANPIPASVTSRALSPIPEVVHPETQRDLASRQQSMPLPGRDLFDDCVLMGQYLYTDINNPSNIRISLQAPLPPKIIPSPTIHPPKILQGDTSLPKRNAFRLTHSWTLYHDCRVRKHTNASLKPSSCTYAANLMAIGQFYSVEGFCRYFNWLKRPSELAMGDSYHLFKSDIEPVWEDPMNENGGAWVLNIRLRPQLLDQTWLWLVMALVGEQLDDNDEICGAVVSLRKVNRIQVWVRSRDNPERINNLERRLLQLLEITSGSFGVHFEFQPHSNGQLPSHKNSTLVSPSTPSTIGRR